jgi:hypothetical protein
VTLTVKSITKLAGITHDGMTIQEVRLQMTWTIQDYQKSQQTHIQTQTSIEFQNPPSLFNPMLISPFH